MVTFIVSTYALPSWLELALRSLQSQDCSDWKALVIGDACGPETKSVIAALNDERFQYINLPERMGEQAGPNSVGLALAEGSHIAFMNHDDVLLPDHLSIALATMETEKTNFFVGRAAVAWGMLEYPSLGNVPNFEWITPEGRKPYETFKRSHLLFEPCSSWVVERTLALRIGAWRSSLLGHRASIQEWLMRAWRSDASFSFDAPLTVLRFNKQFATASGSYSESIAPPKWFDACLNASARQTRGQINCIQAGRQRDRKLGLPRPLPKGVLGRTASYLMVNRLAANLYRHTGFDGFEIVHTLIRSRKGALGAKLSQSRTGFDLTRAPNIPEMIERISTKQCSHSKEEEQAWTR